MASQTGEISFMTPQVGDPFTDTIRAISDFGKSPEQLASEYQQELNLVYGSFLGPGKDTRVYEIWLGQIRRYYTHEQIMSGNFQMPEGKVLSFKETLGPVFHIIAGVIAYVPGIGTAVAFVLNAATSLAEGAPIDEITLTAVKGALPGQPASSMAFDAAVAIARDEPIESVGIALLPIDDQSKEYLKAGARVIRGLAEGEPVTKVALDEIYNQLPPEGQRAMELAQRAANGESIGDLALEEAARAAKNAGTEEFNKFIAQVGYAELMDRLPTDIKNAVEAANALAYAMKAQGDMLPPTSMVPPVALGRVESRENRLINDAHAAAGLVLAKSNPRISVYRSSPPSYVKDVGSWTRGFDVGIGAAQGLTANTPELDKIQKSLGNIPTQSGFNDAKKLQFSITTTHIQSILKGTNQMPALGRVLSAADRSMLVKAAADGAVMAQNNPQILAARNLNPDPRFKWGFDIASSVCVGNSQTGPGQSAVRVKVGPFSPGGSPDGTAVGSNVAMQGFDVGQAIQFGITKSIASGVTQSNNPTVAAGSLVTQGMAGTALSADQKAATMGVVASNPLARQGAQTAIADIAADQNKSFFTKILEFFGLA